ncbi:MAG: dihydrolipoyl dehydrogenase [Bacteroidetes bacterium RIFCSPLOWO2_12_FULL_37_12]|nr:MAG: dihydrolipoyl dehydrogenase [Bacteroidetes bacterium RIFCSPLOWO2_12_FULL_37_12]
METFDVTVIGAGPGGYVAAIRCAQLGLKTALVEKYPSLGGTCLNVGCIPSKALLDATENYFNINHKLVAQGITVGEVKVDFSKMVKRKNDVITQSVAGINYLMKKNKINVLYGTASFSNEKSLEIKSADGTIQNINSANIIIATGSKPSALHGIVIDKSRIITSTEALSLKEIPSSMIIIGGGVIGLELGSVYARLGTKIKVIEYFEEILPNMDRSLGKELRKILSKQLKIEFYLEHKALGCVYENQESVTLSTEDKQKNKNKFTAQYCLVATGRSPYTGNLKLENTSISVDKAGRINVNENLETNVKGVYAIGDVIKGPMLAHKAEEEGVFVAETIAGQKPHINYHTIPGVVYTWPEVASVGFSEEDLKKSNREYTFGTFPFMASGRARASMDTDGFIKVLCDKKTDEILGVHLLGPRAADMVGEAVLAIEFRATAEDIARTCHAHPTYSEAFKEACLAATGNRAIHI